MEDECLFKWKYECGERNEEVKNAGPARVKTIIKFSKECDDNIHTNLEENLQRDPELAIKCNRSCVSTYTSIQHLRRHKKRQGLSSDTVLNPPKSQRRSDVSAFQFKENCIFCGQVSETLFPCILLRTLEQQVLNLAFLSGRHEINTDAENICV